MVNKIQKWNDTDPSFTVTVQNNGTCSVVQSITQDKSDNTYYDIYMFPVFVVVYSKNLIIFNLYILSIYFFYAFLTYETCNF